jgi:hypothetical protein
MDTTLIVPLITGSGVAGVFCCLFILGMVHSDRELKREAHRADTLEAALKEKDAALAEANARADAAVRASELIADAFSDARRRRTTTGRDHGGT